MLRAIGESLLDLYTPKVQETQGHMSSVVLHFTELLFCCWKRDRDLLAEVCSILCLQGVVRHAPHPNTLVSLMVSDTRMSGLSNGMDTCCVFASQSHWTLAVSRKAK